MERIGIYGGAFNPPHIGHIEGAKYAVSALQLSKLYVIPSFTSPHKKAPANSPTPEQRVEMLEVELAGCSKISVSDLELKRGGTSYTVDTVTEMKKQHPNAELILLMGTDMFLSFESWRAPEKILSMASIGVLYRGDPEEETKIDRQKDVLEKKGATVHLVKNPVTTISSTDLRRMLIFGCGEEYIPRGVNAYIRENNLYDVNKSLKNLTQQELEQEVIKLLKPNRVAHVLGCRDTAAELAKRNGINEEEAARAGLLHDITKALSEPLQKAICRTYGVSDRELAGETGKTLHALTGSVIAREVFGESEAVTCAIRTHTTGAPNMSMLQKIIYVADYMEPNRDFPSVEKLRKLAFEDIDAAFKAGLEMTIYMLRQQGREITPQSQAALAYLNRKEETIC